jgi:hypothetical protein
MKQLLENTVAEGGIEPSTQYQANPLGMISP